MYWNEYLYAYHKKHGGQFLAGEDDDGLLLLTWKDRPLVVDLLRESGRGGCFYQVQARLPATLAKPYKLDIGPERTLSAGVNTVLRAVPGLPDNAILPKDFGFPEVIGKRLIRTENAPFTKLALGSLDLRNALLACPQDALKVRPGPGDGPHLITVTTAASINSLSADGGGWYLDAEFYGNEEEKARREAAFFLRMDRFLALIQAAYDAVTQWPM